MEQILEYLLADQEQMMAEMKAGKKRMKSK
jgi:hypothetical protein